MGRISRYVEVKKKILNGEILRRKENDRLPSRTDLIKKYGVTRTTVERAISELIGEGYLYSLIGSGTYISKRQSEKKSGMVNWGIILPNILEELYPSLLRGIEDVASENRINVIVCNSDGREDKQNKYITQLIDYEINGLIINPSFYTSNSYKTFVELKEKGVPCVFVGRPVPGVKVPLVALNNFHGGYIATRHLIETGRRKIASISMPFYATSYERFSGYQTALSEAGIADKNEYHIFSEEFNGSRIGYENAKKLLSLELRPDAIICFSDLIAIGAYEAIYEAGLTVGKEVAVIGFNDTEICKSLPVKLSSVKHWQYEMGKKAAQILLETMSTNELMGFTLECFQPELIVRNSSDKIIKQEQI